MFVAPWSSDVGPSNNSHQTVLKALDPRKPARGVILDSPVSLTAGFVRGAGRGKGCDLCPPAGRRMRRHADQQTSAFDTVAEPHPLGENVPGLLRICTGLRPGHREPAPSSSEEWPTSGTAASQNGGRELSLTPIPNVARTCSLTLQGVSSPSHCNLSLCTTYEGQFIQAFQSHRVVLRPSPRLRFRLLGSSGS